MTESTHRFYEKQVWKAEMHVTKSGVRVVGFCFCFFKVKLSGGQDVVKELHTPRGGVWTGPPSVNGTLATGINTTRHAAHTQQS